MVKFNFFIKWFGLVSTFPKTLLVKWFGFPFHKLFGLNVLKVHKGFGLVFVLYKWFGSVRFSSVSRQRNRTKPIATASKQGNQWSGQHIFTEHNALQHFTARSGTHQLDKLIPGINKLEINP